MNLSDKQENLYILEQIVEQTQGVFFIYDLMPAQFRYISPKFEEIWGVDRYSIAQQPTKIIEFIHPEDLEDLKKTWILANQRIFKPQEFRIITPNKEIKWLLLKSLCYYK